MNTLPKNQAQYRQRLYQTDAATGAAVSLHRARRKDNARQAAEVKGRVKTREAKGYVSSAPEKTTMYEKPACEHLDTQKYLVRKRKQERAAKGSVLRVPKDASPEERANMKRWLATADLISAHLNR